MRRSKTYKQGSDHRQEDRGFRRKQTSDATRHVQLGYIVCLADFVSLVTYESDVYLRILPRVGNRAGQKYSLTLRSFDKGRERANENRRRSKV